MAEIPRHMSRITMTGDREPRTRFREAGAEAVNDYELLELVLFRAIPRRDIKPLTKALIATFGSFPEVISAPSARLAEINGLGAAAITELKIVHAAATRLARGQVRKRPVLSSWSNVIDYCRTTMAFAEESIPCPVSRQAKSTDCRRATADRHGRSHARLSARGLKRALELSATALILVHNHPSGDPTPSHADIEMTRTIVEVAKPLGIAVHDHIIVGRDGHASFKGLKLV